MKNTTRRVAWGLLFLVVSLPAGAQTGDAPEERMDLAEVRKLRGQVEENASLADDLRTGSTSPDFA